MDGFENCENIDEDIQNAISSWKHATLVRNGCLAHLLQLAVKDSIRKSNLATKLIKKVNEVVTFFTKGVMWKESLKKESGNLTLIKPIETRWNSAYNSIERILRDDKKCCMVKCINKVIAEARDCQRKNGGKSKIPALFTDEEVSQLKNISQLLEPLASLTDDFQTDGVSSSLVIIGVINAMQEVQEYELILTDLEAEAVSELEDFKSAIIRNVAVRFTGKLPENSVGFQKSNHIVTIDVFNNRSYILASVLDPRTRLLPFEKIASNGLVISDNIPNVNSAKEILREAFEEEKSVLNPTSRPKDVDNSAEKNASAKRKRIFDRLSSIAAKKAKTSSDNESDFFQEYFDYINLSLGAEDMNKCPLAFWKCNVGRFPILSQLARKYLAMPASSGSIERLFSVAGAIKRARRANLNVETVEKLLLLRDDLMRLHFQKT